jgi:hypothetical protein
MGSPGWIDRYVAGNRTDVWHELRQLGAAVHEGDLGAEAQQVCDEMARRARWNIEVIVERLNEQGYRFHANDDDQTPVVPHRPPGPHAPRVIEWLQSHFDRVPMTLLSWTRHVGDVWLVGTHPQWPESTAADPLVIEVEGSAYPGASIENYYEEELRAHRNRSSSNEENVGPFVLPVSPDRLHKDNVSGGQPYGIRLPDGCVDGLFVGETVMPFVDYLNWVFRNGGFPVSTESREQWRIRRSLAEGLMPL